MASAVCIANGIYFVAVEGAYILYTAMAQENLRAPPPREGEGGGSPPPPNNRFHPNRCRSRLSRPRDLGRTGLVEGGARKRGRGVVAVVEQRVTVEGESGEGRG
jgi:hypothetical protein